jgi:hypothetical protein
MTNDVRVRLAVPEDEAALLEHVRLLHGENGLFSLSDDKVKRHLARAFDREGAIIGVIGEPGKPLEASIYLALEQPYYSDEMHIMELWTFVAPPREKRAGHARKLIEFAKDCSDRMDRMPLVIGILSNDRLEAKKRLYERQLETAGMFFIHNRAGANGNWSSRH